LNPNLRYLGIGAAVRALGFSLFGPFLALYLHNILAVDYIELGVIFFVLGIVPIPFSLGGGLLTDRIGRRRLFLLTLAGESASCALLAYAMWIGSLWLGLSSVLVFSIVSSVGGPALSAYVADFATGSERTKGFTWWRVGVNAGFALGVASGGLLLPVLGFPMTTALSALVLAVGVVLLAIWLEPSPVEKALTLSAAEATQAKAKAATPGPWVPPVPSPHKRPKMRDSLRVMMSDKPFLGICLATALALVTMGQWGTTLSLFANGRMGISYQILGLGLALNGIVVVIGQTATTNSVLGRRLTTIAIGGALLYVVSFLAMGASALYAFYPVAVFFVGVGVLTIGENLSAIMSSTLPSNMAPAGELGSYNGAFGAVATVGGLVSTLVGGIALQYVPNQLEFWGLLCLPVVPAIWLMRRSGRAVSPKVDRA
jgi:MFS family permease